MKTVLAAAAALTTLALASLPALAQNVKITPIGSHPGELCANDRAMVFEDPSGVRPVQEAFREVLGIRLQVAAVPLKSLPRFELKARRLVRR